MKKYRNIVINSRCNLNCSYCSSHDFDVDVPRVIKSLERIFDKFSDDKVVFRVECFGEITLYKEIINYLSEISKKNSNYDIEILTNGLLMSKYVYKYDSIKWVFSLDGHTEEMNIKRGLKQKAIDEILKYILMLDAEIQCVYWGQKVSDINDFIKFLRDRTYNGFVHIFPELNNPKTIDVYLNYDELIKTDFIPEKDYFMRWKQLYEGHERNFICDHMLNGFVYQINEIGKIKAIKCDCINNHKYEMEFGDIEKDEFDCMKCIQHNEYNNKRKIMV